MHNGREDQREREQRQLEEFREFLREAVGRGDYSVIPFPPPCAVMALTPVGIVRRFLDEPCAQCKPLLHKHFNN